VNKRWVVKLLLGKQETLAFKIRQIRASDRSRQLFLRRRIGLVGA
jgi:hypothetical protein